MSRHSARTPISPSLPAHRAVASGLGAPGPPPHLRIMQGAHDCPRQVRAAVLVLQHKAEKHCHRTANCDGHGSGAARVTHTSNLGGGKEIT